MGNTGFLYKNTEQFWSPSDPTWWSLVFVNKYLVFVVKMLYTWKILENFYKKEANEEREQWTLFWMHFLIRVCTGKLPVPPSTIIVFYKVYKITKHLNRFLKLSRKKKQMERGSSELYFECILLSGFVLTYKFWLECIFLRFYAKKRVVDILKNCGNSGFIFSLLWKHAVQLTSLHRWASWMG